MSTKDISQTHKEYVERKHRIKKSNEFDAKLEKKANEIHDIDEQIEHLYKMKAEKENERNGIKSEKFKTLLVEYNNPGLLKDIFSKVRHTTYSRSLIGDIESRCEEGVNVDDADFELIENIVLADQAIIEQISHTNIISDILNNLGDSIEIPGEADGKDGT